MGVNDDGARRFWTYGKDHWDGPLVSKFPGGDEYGNSTLVFRLPQGRAFVMAYNWPLRRELEPSEGRTEYAHAPIEPLTEDWEHDLFGEVPWPVEYSERHRLPRRGWKLVRRDVMYGPWEDCDE